MKKLSAAILFAYAFLLYLYFKTIDMKKSNLWLPWAFFVAGIIAGIWGLSIEGDKGDVTLYIVAGVCFLLTAATYFIGKSRV